MTLADLNKGDQVRIKKIDLGDDPSMLRLMSLGLVEGVALRLIGHAIGGDPMEFRLYGGAVSLRRAQARHIQVVRIHDVSGASA